MTDKTTKRELLFRVVIELAVEILEFTNSKISYT